MSSLILTVISVLLLSAMVLISINYLPGWTKEAGDVTPAVRQSSLELERAFQLYAKAHADTPASIVSGDADGGLAANFAPFLGFTPAAIPGYQWVYGETSPGAPAGYPNTFYFCLAPQSGGQLASQGKFRGAIRAQAYLSDEQAFVSPTCGSPSNTSYGTSPSAMAFTYFVRYVPGQR